MTGELSQLSRIERWKHVERRLPTADVSPLISALVKSDGRIIVSYLPEADGIFDHTYDGEESEAPLSEKSYEQLHGIIHSIAHEFVESQLVRSLPMPAWR